MLTPFPRGQNEAEACGGQGWPWREAGSHTEAGGQSPERPAAEGGQDCGQQEALWGEGRQQLKETQRPGQPEPFVGVSRMDFKGGFLRTRKQIVSVLPHPWAFLSVSPCPGVVAFSSPCRELCCSQGPSLMHVGLIPGGRACGLQQLRLARSTATRVPERRTFVVLGLCPFHGWERICLLVLPNPFFFLLHIDYFSPFILT